MPDASAETIGSNPADDCMAYIVGPNHFQNTMLAAYIETHSKGKSAVFESITAIVPGERPHSSGRTAVLYDCFVMQGSDLPHTLMSELEKLPPEWSLALFNLDRGASVEKKALELGVHGFFYQDDTVETLLRGLSAIFGGEFWVSRQSLAQIALENSFGSRRKQLAAHAYPHDLTGREVEILGLLTLGASNEVIADKLCISNNTVRTHLNHIFKKINVSSRLEASLWAVDSLFSRKHDMPL